MWMHFPGLGHLLVGKTKKGGVYFCLFLGSLLMPYVGVFMLIYVYYHSINDLLKKQRGGYYKGAVSLISILSVFFFLGIVVFFCLFFLVHFLLSNSLNNVAMNELDEIIDYVNTYYAENSQYPSDLEGFFGDSPIKKKYKTDPWGNEYLLSFGDCSVVIKSKGKDGVAGTKDDMIMKCNNENG